MTAHLRKELRALAAPAGIVVAIALTGVWGAANPAIFFGLPGLWLRTGLLAFVIGTPLIAALSFGSEFRHRTLVLSMSQPIGRARLWSTKWLVLLAVLAVVAGVELAAAAVWSPGNLPLRSGVVFLLLVVCSAPLWTLVSRSTIGGLVFTMSGIFMLEFGLSDAAFRLTGIAPDHSQFLAAGAVFDVIRAAYAAGTLWLGWFVFSRFEAAGAGVGERSIGRAHAGWSWLLARPSGPLANLVRKELVFQRPALLTAGLFLLLWATVVGLIPWHAIRPEFADILLPAMLGTYVPLVTVLVGTMSVGEETSLGIRTWHLTMPVSSRTQWAIKLGIAAAAAAILGAALPALLTFTTYRLGAGSHGGEFYRSAGFFLMVAGGVLLTFWSSTLFGEMLKASLASGVVLLGIGLAASLGFRVGEWLPFRQPWWPALIVRFELPPSYFHSSRVFAALPYVAAAMVVAVGLWQSLGAFRRARVSVGRVAQSGAVLFAAVFLAAVGVSNTASSAWTLDLPVLRDLSDAIRNLPAPAGEEPYDAARSVSLDQLYQGSRPSPDTRRWLAHATITVQPWPLFRRDRRAYLVTLQFPRGRSFKYVVRGEPER